METIQTILFKATTSAATTLFIYNSILLFLSNHKNRGKKILAFTMLIWGIFYLTLMVCDYLNIEITTYPVFSVKTLIISNVFICIMYLYPLTTFYTSKLNIQTISLLFVPSISISIIYLSVLSILDEQIEELSTFQELKNSLSNFNVWYRFIFLGCNLVYSSILLKIIHNQKKEVPNKETYGKTQEITNTAWMNYYFDMMIVLVVFYVVTIFWGSQWNVIIYNAVIIGCFTILFYKGLFHYHTTCDNSINGYKEDESAQILKEEQKENDICNSLADYKTYSFENKIPFYTKAIKKWLEDDKPYLNKDFQLTDVTTFLPLNRSYLSRVFNEGFKQTFSDVVRLYRIRYAQNLMANNPQLPLNKIAEISGFTSYATFMRAFLKVTGIPPKKYKINDPTSFEQSEINASDGKR